MTLIERCRHENTGWTPFRYQTHARNDLVQSSLRMTKDRQVPV